MVIVLLSTCMVTAREYFGVLAGTVYTTTSDEPADSVFVGLGDSLYHAYTDSAGHYRIGGIKPGTYTLSVSKKGYLPQQRYSMVINPDSRITIDFVLEPDVADLKRIVVSGTRRNITDEVVTARHSLDIHQIADQPGGNYDLQRALSTLPSFVGGFDESNDIIVIGGNNNENLFLLDGVEVFNPNHFSGPAVSGGVLSIIDPSLVRRMDFYAGAFPAKYGNKASSVLSLDLREGATDRYHYKTDIGAAGFGGTVEGPIPSGSALFTAHRSFVNLIYKFIDPELTMAPTYTSVVGKATVEPVAGHHFSLLGILSDDYTGEKGPTWDYKYNGGQQIATLRHETRFGDVALNSDAALVRQRIHVNQMDQYDVNNYRDDFIQSSLSGQSRCAFNPVPGLQVETGVRGERLFFDHERFALGDTIKRYDLETDSVAGVLGIIEPIDYDDDLSFNTGSWYLQGNADIGSHVSAAFGGRVDYYGYTKELSATPRASLTLHFPKHVDMSIAGGRHRQPPDSYLLLRDPRNKDLKSRYADHALFGITTSPGSDLKITIEGFYKRYRDLAISEASLTDDPFDWSQRFVNEGKSRTVGGDVFIEKQLKKNFWGSLSYSYAQSKWYDPRDPSRMFDADLDYRHHLSALVGYRQRYRERKWFKRLDATWWYRILKVIPLVPADESDYSIRWRFLGGRPYTPQYYDSSLHRWRIDEDTPYNSVRMTPYSRIDLHFKERIYSGRVSVITYVEALNILDHDNLFWFVYRNDTAEKIERYQMPRLVLGGVIVEY